MWHPKIIRTCPLAVHTLLLLTVVLNTTTRSDELHRAESPQTMVLSEDGGWGYAGRHAQVAQNRLFYSYLDQEGISWVASFDFETGQITQTPLGKGNNDLHSSNPLFIRPDGRIQVFLDRGGYTDRHITWRVSREPWSVAEFGQLQQSELEADILQGRQFYAVVHPPTGSVYLVINALRADQIRKTVMWKSPDGGDSWTEYHNLWALGKGLSGNRCYSRIFLRGDEIHFLTLRVGWGEPLAEHPIGRVEGVYYIRYNVTNRTFHRADGSPSFALDDTPLYDTRHFDEIWNWSRDGQERQRAVWSDMVADATGRPFVTFAVQDAVPRGQSQLHEGYWATPNAEGRWHFHHVATLARGWDNTPERKNLAIAIDPHDPHAVFLARSTSEADDLSQIQRMVTRDGGARWDTTDVLSEEGRLTTVVIPQVLDDSRREVDVLWLEGRMEGWRSYATQVVARRMAAPE